MPISRSGAKANALLSLTFVKAGRVRLANHFAIKDGAEGGRDVNKMRSRVSDCVRALAPLWLALVSVAFVHAAQAAGDAKRGEQIAAMWCAACHKTGRGAVRPDENEPASFQEIADTPGMTGLALKVFFQTPHKEMPNFKVTGEIREDLTAYILSLKSDTGVKR